MRDSTRDGDHALRSVPAYLPVIGELSMRKLELHDEVSKALAADEDKLRWLGIFIGGGEFVLDMVSFSESVKGHD